MLPSSLQRHHLFDAHLVKPQVPYRHYGTQFLLHTFTCSAAVVVTPSQHLSGPCVIPYPQTVLSILPSILTHLLMNN